MSDILTSSSFRIMQNGVALNVNILVAIDQVTVESELNVPAMFSFRMSMMSFLKDNWQGIDLSTFKLGDTIQISMGLAQAQVIFEGEIFALEPSFGQYSTLEVRGYDRMYYLNFGTHTRTFVEMTYSDIVFQIAQSIGLIPKVDATTTVISYLLQNNQTNYEFLKDFCGWIKYEMLIDTDEGNFVFRKSPEGLSPTLTFTYGENLFSLNLRLKVLTQNSRVNVVAWNSQQKTVIMGQAEQALPLAKMGGTKTGYDISVPLSASPVNIQNLALVDATQATDIAQAQFNQEMNQFIEGDGSCIGNPNMKPGINIQINGLGPRFSGIYYVISTTHTFNKEQGYQTSFKVRRSGI